MLRLPPWGALTEDQRRLLREHIEDGYCAECQYVAGQSALDFYNLIRRTICLMPPPLMAALSSNPGDGVSPMKRHANEEKEI